MRTATRDALVDRLAGHDRVVEVGIGTSHEVATALAASGTAVTATDIYERTLPATVRFVRDDITDPDVDVYATAGAIYALNLPPELHRPARDVATRVGAELAFTTLGGDPAAIPVERETLPGETLYRASGLERSANGKTRERRE